MAQPKALSGRRVVRCSLFVRDKIILCLALGLGAGRMPKAPGTCGSLLGLLWMVVLYSISGFGWTLSIIVVSILIGVWVCSQAERILKLRDPGCIVLDEILAVPIACLGWMLGCSPSQDRIAAISSGENWEWLLGAPAIFVLFRFFDIAKPWPINVVQRLPTGWGVMADDVLAAVYAGFLLFFLSRLLCG